MIAVAIGLAAIGLIGIYVAAGKKPEQPEIAASPEFIATLIATDKRRDLARLNAEIEELTRLTSPEFDREYEEAMAKRAELRKALVEKYGPKVATTEEENK